LALLGVGGYLLYKNLNSSSSDDSEDDDSDDSSDTETITYVPGDQIKCTLKVTHYGQAYSGAKAYVALAQNTTALLGSATAYDEVSGATASKTFSVDADEEEATYTLTLTITIPEGIDTGYYELYAKIYNTPGSNLYAYSALDVIYVEGD